MAACKEISDIENYERQPVEFVLCKYSKIMG